MMRLVLLAILLLTSLAWSETDVSHLTSLMMSGEYEKLVVEGEILGEQLRGKNDREGTARVYQLLTIAYLRLGRFDDMKRCNAISKGIQAEQNLNSTDRTKRERAVVDKASALFSSGDTEATISYVDQHLADWPDDSFWRHWIFRQKFQAIWDQQSKSQALDALEREVSLLEQRLASYPSNGPSYRANLGLTYLLGSDVLAYQDPARSLIMGQKADGYLYGPEPRTKQLPGENNLPYRVAAASGRYQDARKEYHVYSKGAEYDAFQEALIRSRDGYWLEQLGQDKEAYRAYSDGLENLDGAWSGLKLRESKQDLVFHHFRGTFLPPPSLIFERAITLAIKLNQWDEALRLSELYKSRTLRDALSREFIAPKKKVLEADLADEKKLFRKLAAEPKHEDVQKYMEVLDRIRQQDPEYADMLSGQPGELKLPTLQEGEVLVEYFLTEDSILLFVLKPQDQNPRNPGLSKTNPEVVLATSHPMTQKSLNKAVKRARTGIKQLLPERSLKRRLEVLSRALITPVEDELAGAERVIFVPHGELHYIPFSSLLTSDGRYLVEQFEVVEAPSAHSLSFSQKKNPKRQPGFQTTQQSSQVFALGDYSKDSWAPLPGTAQEARTIEMLLPRTRSLVADQLKHEGIKAGIEKSEILHIATHGFLDHQNPLKSGLVTSDRPLTVADVLTRRLSAYSVFLSACDTAMGKQTAADEIVGLQQSFMYAGTPSVIASLWQVSDEATAELVKSYYGQLRTVNKGAALRQAQLEMLQSPQHSHPYFWSAFILSGDWI
jgi:CHAT domain-containing protein